MVASSVQRREIKKKEEIKSDVDKGKGKIFNYKFIFSKY